MHDQDNCPISKSELHKCDVWAFGLLAWEVFLDGKEYTTVVGGAFDGFKDGNTLTPEGCERLIHLAKESVPFSKGDVYGSVLRAIFPMTLNWNSTKRISNLAKLPVMTAWQYVPGAALRHLSKGSIY